MFFGTFFVYLSSEYWIIGETVPISFWIILGVSVPVGILIYCTTKPDTAPKWSVLFSIISLILCIFWIEFFSGILVDLIGLLGMVMNINTAFLGATILAWGNSVGDFVANVGISRRGLA